MELTDELANDCAKLVGKFVSKNRGSRTLFDSYEDMYSELLTTTLDKVTRLYDPNKSKLSTFIFMVCGHYCGCLSRKITRRRKFLNGLVSMDEELNWYEDSAQLPTLHDIIQDPVNNFEIAEADLIISKLLPYLNKEAKMYYLDGISTPQISELTGRTQSCVCRKIKRCLGRMRGLLETGKLKKRGRKKK